MRSRYPFKAFLAIAFLSWIVSIPALASGQKQAVNRFYKQLVGILHDSEFTAQDLATLVSKNRILAERCLLIMKKKAGKPGQPQESFQYVCKRLEDTLLLTSKSPDCSNPAVANLLTAASSQLVDEDKEFYLERIVSLCPENPDAYNRLGDLYLKERRAGMAVAAYKKALELKNDDDSRKLLAKAEELLADYAQGKSITPDDVRKLFKQNMMAPIPGMTVRKVEIRNAIQTNQIRFDEWSYRIKEEFQPQLRAIGQVLEDEFRENTGSGLLVEGHTDIRGPLERNMKLSRDRAAAIRNYLVENFRIEPSRITTKGYGPHKPFSPREDEEGWAMNRRVEFKKIDLADYR